MNIQRIEKEFYNKFGNTTWNEHPTNHIFEFFKQRMIPNLSPTDTTDRYRVIANFPGSEFKVDEIIWDDKVIDYGKFTSNFKKLQWWEERTFDFMMSVRFCKIIKTNGYWREGDILPVSGFITDTLTLHPVFKSYILKGYHNETYDFKQVIPVTAEEFFEWKKKNKISISPDR